MTHADYIRLLKPLLPKNAFEPVPRKLIPAGVHTMIIVAGWLSFRFLRPAYWPIMTIVIGHSLACLAFIAHELSHRSIIRDSKMIRCLELLFWSLNFFPPTLWNKLHNESHHVRPNTNDDPDRRFIMREKSPATTAFTAIFFPHRGLKYNVLCLLQFVTYILRHAVAVFYVGRKKPSINTFKPQYGKADKLRVLGEILFIVLLQRLAFLAVGRKWSAYIWASPLAIFFTSAVVMIYVFTNHFLNPLGDGTDPVKATTSVIVPTMFDRLHFNFSYHTEHHLFPNMNSVYYPDLSRLLVERFSGEYNRILMRTAWSQLWRLDFFAQAPQIDAIATSHAQQSSSDHGAVQ
jgi:fatty acid desaturase